MEQFKTDIDINVEDMLLVIQEYKEIDFIPLYEDLKNKILISDITNDIIEPFISYNKELQNRFLVMKRENMESFFYIMLDEVQREIESLNLTPNLNVKEKIWDEKISIKANIVKRIRDNKRKSEIQVEHFIRIENASELAYTQFELEKDTNELTLNINNSTLIEIFNYVKLNPNTPFASINNFYKILKDFIPYEEWSITTEDIILMVSPEIDIISNPKINNYSTMIVEETEEKEIVVNFYFNKTADNLSKEELIKRILEIFPKIEKLEVKSLVTYDINGFFYFPNTTLNKHVMSDLIMNDPMFSKMLSVNEGQKATTSRNSLYIHFNHLNTGPITATLTEQGKETKYSSLFPLGQKFIRVKVKSSKNQEAVKEFQRILSKLLTLYYEEYPKIVQIYREFIPDFAVNDMDGISEDQEEDKGFVFPPNFIRRCPGRPTVIKSEKQENDAKKANKRILVFPRDQDVVDDPSKQKKFICEVPGKPYPGLMKNVDSDSNVKYPLLPCCYANDPTNTKYEGDNAEAFRDYYGIPQEKKTYKKVQQNLFVSNKFLEFEAFGKLPKNINRLFHFINTDRQYSYFSRTGVFKTKHSFLNCVLIALGDETIQTLDTVEQVEAYLSDFRKRAFIKTAEKVGFDLLPSEIAAACKQEMYDYSTEEILLNIQDPEVYFDPKLFIHLLEEIFNCNIIIFYRDNSIKNGEMILPRHVQSYQKIKNNKPCIFIYEHVGSESDRAEYPRCELIVKSNKTDPKDNTYTFNQNELIYTNINQVYNSMRETYSLNRLNEEIEFPIRGTSQKIDSYGKVRMLNVNYENRLISLMTSPIQPFAIQETMEEVVYKVDVNTATTFAASVRMLIDGKIVIDKKIKEILGKIGNVRVSIPIEESVPSSLQIVPLNDNTLNYVDSDTSTIEIFNKNKKLARYIFEYMIWLYSIFLRDSGIIKLIPEQMFSFANQYITINPSFKYGDVPKKFNETSGLMSNGKLVVKSQETLKRLLYVLRLEAIRNPQRILTYHQRDSIENFYMDITDFDQYKSQVILEGADSVKKWTQERKVNYVIHDDILMGNTPYFFKNKYVGTKLFLAQNTETMKKAIAIAKTWYENGYNPSNTVSETGLVQFTLLAFRGPTNIKSYSIQGPNYKKNIKILGYKLNDESKFTVLLPL